MGAPVDVVAPDGSPVAVYLALPAGDAPELVHSVVGPGAAILALGCGAGRLTRVLAALGHPVTAVDESEAMLAHVTVADVVAAPIDRLVLGRRFDAVLAASHLVNRPGPSWRARLLGVAASHLAPGGVVLVERYPPGWLLEAGASSGRRGPVAIEFSPRHRDGRVVTAEVAYVLGGRRWVQRFSAEDVDDEALATAAAAAGLRVAGTLTDDASWVALTAAADQNVVLPMPPSTTRL